MYQPKSSNALFTNNIIYESFDMEQLHTTYDILYSVPFEEKSGIDDIPVYICAQNPNEHQFRIKSTPYLSFKEDDVYAAVSNYLPGPRLTPNMQSKEIEDEEYATYLSNPNMYMVPSERDANVEYATYLTNPNMYMVPFKRDANVEHATYLTKPNMYMVPFERDANDMHMGTYL